MVFGGGGYWTELLARAVGPDGKVTAAAVDDWAVCGRVAERRP